MKKNDYNGLYRKVEKMARFRCVFLKETAGSDSASAPIEVVYEFEAENIDRLYAWLASQDVPADSIKEIVPVEEPTVCAAGPPPRRFSLLRGLHVKRIHPS